LVDGEESPGDILAIFETKTQFSGNRATNRLQDAVNGSANDQTRKAESLNAIKQRLFDRGNLSEADQIERFQNLEDKPYTEVSGAAALFSTHLYDSNLISDTSTREHTNARNLLLIIIRGYEMMDLVHELYRRAADEA